MRQARDPAARQGLCDGGLSGAHAAEHQGDADGLGRPEELVRDDDAEARADDRVDQADERGGAGGHLAQPVDEPLRPVFAAEGLANGDVDVLATLLRKAGASMEAAGPPDVRS